MKAKLRRAIGEMACWPQVWRLIWAAAPRHSLAWAALLVIQGLMPAASVYLTKLLVDRLTATLGRPTWEGAQPALALIALLAGALLLTELLQSLGEWVRAAQSERIQDHVRGLVHRQAATLDLAAYESPAHHDRLEQARGEGGSRALALLESAGGVVQSSLTLVGMVAILAPYGPFLPAALIGTALPALYVAIRFDRRYHAWWKRTTSERRRAQYFDLVLTSASSAAELRLFDLGAHFSSAYQDVRRRLRSERLGLMREQGLARLGAAAVMLLVTGATMAWMVWRALQGLVSLGDLVLLYQAFQRGQGLMRALLGNIGQVYSNTLYLGNLFEFLALRPAVADPARPIAAPSRIVEGIRFRGVTFRYPGSNRPALRDFDLSLPAGRITAIVGPNGAGKSTLVKLLCRFYDPETGAVEVDGIDLRRLRLGDLRRLITVLFQFPVPYCASLAENIALGDLGAAPGPAEIASAARSAGADDLARRLPRGYDTLLGKWFDEGAELSGGEWQRVATARAFLRRAPIVVLDEPTSLMDSWAEADWFGRLRALAAGRVGLVITHRFTIAMRADVIHVMDEGRIVESGSHLDLLARGGLYARSWAMQMQASHDGAPPDRLSDPQDLALVASTGGADGRWPTAR